MKFRSDFDLYGFATEEIFSFLAKHGIDLERGPPSLEPATGAPAFTRWQHRLAIAPYTTEEEAAAALAAVDIFSPG